MNHRSPFFPIWIGQLVSIFGSSLSSFAFGVWLYQQTGSSSYFAWVAICTALPVLLLSPLAGVWVDRYPRRWVMAAADSGAALCTLAAAALFFSGHIQPWHIFLFTALNAACGALQVPAYSALVADLVPETQLARANGLIQFGQGLAEILAPSLAGALVGWIGVPGVLGIDLATFLIGIATLLAAPVKEPAARHSRESNFSLSQLWAELKAGWEALRNHLGLVSLLRFQMLFGFLWSLFGVLVTPMVLGFSDAQGLGIALTMAGGGMLAGSLVLSAWGGPRRRLNGILGFELVSAAAFVGMGLRPELGWVAVSALLAHFTLAFVSGLSQSIWQSQVDAVFLGRVLALRQALVKAAGLLAYLAAGGLADQVLEPALRPGGWLVPGLGSWVGVGPGRGIAVLMIAIGIVKALAVLRVISLPEVRQLQQTLPQSGFNKHQRAHAGESPLHADKS